MSKEKQIEEMVANISERQNGGWKFVGDSEYTTDVYNEELAEHLYNAGYRKHSEGEWIWTENGEADCEKYWVCSVCKEHDFVKTKHCPNCGAEMKGGAE